MEDKRLKRVFDQVKFSREREEAMLADLLTEKEEVSSMKQKNRRRIPAAVLVAAALVIALAGTAFAAVFDLPDILADWFGQRWEEEIEKPVEKEQLELLNRLTRPVGVSDTCGGVTITADSATVGDSSLWVLLVVDGLEGPLPEPGEAGDWFHMYHTGMDRSDIAPLTQEAFKINGMGFGVYSSNVTEDGRLCLIYCYEPQISGSASLLDGCRVTFQTDEIGYGNETLAEGNWLLEFDLEPAEGTPVLTLQDVQFPAKYPHGGETEDVLIDMTEVRVSSTDVTFRLDAGDSLRMAYQFDMTLLFRDGTEINCTELPEMGSHDEEKNEWVVTKNLPLPIDLTQVESLRVGGMEFPLQ